MSAYFATSIYTISNTMKLNFKYLKNASPTNFTNKKEDQVPFFIRPTKSERIRKQNITTDETSHNEAINDPLVVRFLCFLEESFFIFIFYKCFLEESYH